MKYLRLLLLVLTLPGTALAADAPPADITAVADGNNAFAADLYAQLDGQKGNLFFSPVSISTALAMTYAGAAGATAAQMEKTLHFTLGQGTHPAIKELLAQLTDGNGDSELDIANALWVQEGYKLTDFYNNTVKNAYDAAPGQLDFKMHAVVANRIINEWVSERTRHKINNLLPPGIPARDTRVILTNAVYFKAAWLQAFSPDATQDGIFTDAKGEAVHVPFMHEKKTFAYLPGDGFEALALPYRGGDLSMVIFLPGKDVRLSAFEKRLTADNLAKWIAGLKPVPEVDLALPKFKMDREFSLADTLAAMGMTSAFDPQKADFSRMTGYKDLFISAVLHKAYIDVDEKGTEAAAATAVGMSLAMAMQHPAPPVAFHADRPFVFLIRDNRSGSILFMGRVSNPAGNRAD